MLKWLFNRQSRMVLAMEIFGLGLLGFGSMRFALERSPALFTLLMLLISWCFYLFLRFCAFHRWHGGLTRSEGIGLQFQKSLVPMSYLMACFGIWFCLTLTVLPLLLLNVALAIIAHVHVILLYLSSRDHDPTPVNHYSSGRFLHIS